MRTAMLVLVAAVVVAGRDGALRISRSVSGASRRRSSMAPSNAVRIGSYLASRAGLSPSPVMAMWSAKRSWTHGRSSVNLVAHP